MKNPMKALFKGLSILALAVGLAGCGGGDDDEGSPGSSNTSNTSSNSNNNSNINNDIGGGNGKSLVVPYSAYVPNERGQDFDHVVDVDAIAGKVSIVIGGREQHYTLNTLHGNDACTVRGGTGSYSLNACDTLSHGDIVMLCPTVADIPTVILQRTRATHLKPASLAELQQVAMAPHASEGLAMHMAACSDSPVSTRNHMIVLPDGSATMTVEGAVNTLTALRMGELTSFVGFTGELVKAGMKIYKWFPEDGTGSLQTVRYLVLFTGTPTTNDPNLPMFPPLMYVTPAKLRLPAR